MSLRALLRLFWRQFRALCWIFSLSRSDTMNIGRFRHVRQREPGARRARDEGVNQKTSPFCGGNSF